MAGRQALTINLHIDGVRATLAAFNRMPREANRSLRQRTLDVAETLAGHIRQAAIAEGGQAAAVAGTVKARRDRVPVIEAGGSKRVTRTRAPAWALLFGSEFGMDARSGWYAAQRFADSPGRQYRPHRGRDSYWFFATAERRMGEVADAWQRVVDDIRRDFSAGP